jgi:hypothetical protein
VLDDAFPPGARAPGEQFVQLGATPAAEAWAGAEVLSGHFGRLPLRLLDPPPAVVCVLREPAARAWSHYRALPGGMPFGEWLEHPVQAVNGRDYQARWLGVENAERRPDGSRAGMHLPEPAGPQPTDVGAAARATLAGAAVAGTSERLGDVVAALERLLGRRLPEPGRINAGDGRALPAAEAALIRARSPLDLALHDEAGRRLDAALATLPPVPDEPLVALPHVYGIEQPLAGRGFHARVHTPAAGWHRWTGPGTESELRLPVRAGGPAVLGLAILAAAGDDVVRSVQLAVQGRPVAHVLEPAQVGVRATARAVLDPAAPLTVTLRVGRTAHLTGPGGERSPDPAGLALGTVTVAPA